MGVEHVEDLVRVIAKRHQQSCGWQLPLPVDPNVQNVFGVELKVQPRAAVRNDPRREEQFTRRVRLTLIVIEEHTWRPVHLAHNNTLSTVHDEGTFIGHQRDIPEIDFLLFNFFDRLGAGVFVNVKHDQLQAHFQRRCICQIALHTFFSIEFRRLKLIRNIFERRALVEIDDWEH